MLSADERAAVERIFRAYGYDQPLRVAPPLGDDERVFVLPASALAHMPEGSVVAELQGILGRKVWLASELGWPITEPLR